MEVKIGPQTFQISFQDTHEKIIEDVEWEPEINVKHLLEAGCHFGHPTSKLHPKMRPYIFSERNGIHIINIAKTVEMLKKACKFAYKVASEGGIILFVGTKKVGKEFIKSYAQECGMPYIVSRWLGGTLTNFHTILNGIRRYNEYRQLVESGEVYKLYTKKEANKIKRRVEKMARHYEGIKDLDRLPDALFVVGVREEMTCIREANKMGIPVIAPVDTNCDPDLIDWPFPGNDDAMRSIKYYCMKIAEAIKAGREKFKQEQGIVEKIQIEEGKAPATTVSSEEVQIALTEHINQHGIDMSEVEQPEVEEKFPKKKKEEEGEEEG